jgi:hypothetical protein
MKLITASVNAQLDDLLTRLCHELAITNTQHERAVGAYTTLGDWIGDEKGPLGTFSPRIFPQGSIPLGTTVKPRQSEEFDADLVCVFRENYSDLTPQRLYDLVLNRVMDHETYRPMVEHCDRCVRLNYENQFHLDIVPAVPWAAESPTRVGIPNHDKTQWQHTDPEGFLRWFRSRQVTHHRVFAEKRAEVEPMPANGDPEDKTTLQRIVQLLKRRRDVYFDGADAAPKSILLTTLAGNHYGQELITTDAMLTVLDRILAAARNTNDIPVVENPSNPGENLARHWQEDQQNYLAFLEFCVDLADGIKRLLRQQDTMKIAEVLQELFDPEDGRMVKRAVASFTEDFQKARQSGEVRMAKGGALTTAAVTAVRSVAIPTNKFFGA